MSSIDQSVLDGIREMAGEGDREFLKTLIQLFTDSSPAKVQKMKDALSRNDGKAASFEAHSIKSSAASLGAMTVSKLAAEIEKKTKSGSIPPEVIDSFPFFEREFSLAMKELQSHLVDSSELKKAA